jgi:hypothetical protein
VELDERCFSPHSVVCFFEIQESTPRAQACLAPAINDVRQLKNRFVSAMPEAVLVCGQTSM